MDSPLIRVQENRGRFTVSSEDQAEARKIDHEDYILVRERFLQIGRDIGERLSISKFHEIRERLDDIVLFSMGVGGPAHEIAGKADQLRNALISDVREAP